MILFSIKNSHTLQGIPHSLEAIEFAVSRPLLRSKGLDRQRMDAVVGNIFHQRRVDALLLFHPTHAIEHLTHSNNLKVAAIARDVDFLEGSAFISTV